jgi:tRNA(Ile)-lysidine synthase TilS/MesJ
LSGDFVRARYDDLEDFFKDNSNLDEDDENLNRIRAVLKAMEKNFAQRAESISSRAVAVSAYLFCEQLYTQKRQSQIEEFARFYEKLLHEIKENLKLLTRFKPPTNGTVLEEFQKYISQASVESYAVKRRHLFLENAFEYFLSPKTKAKIIGSK